MLSDFRCGLYCMIEVIVGIMAGIMCGGIRRDLSCARGGGFFAGRIPAGFMRGGGRPYSGGFHARGSAA
jgi:hypothetical protein